MGDRGHHTLNLSWIERLKVTAQSSLALLQNDETSVNFRAQLCAFPVTQNGTVEGGAGVFRWSTCFIRKLTWF